MVKALPSAVISCQPLVTAKAVLANVEETFGKLKPLLNVVKPVTPRVPAAVVLPLEAVTVNLLVLIATSPVTPNVPTIAVLPVELATVNLSVPEAVSIVNVFESPFILTLLSNVVLPVTSNVPAMSILLANLAPVTASSAIFAVEIPPSVTVVVDTGIRVYTEPQNVAPEGGAEVKDIVPVVLLIV